MVARVVMISILVLLAARAQAQSCFATAQLDRHSVYVQQPFKVTITVMTATWFTAPVEFDNLQVPNAFVLPFDRNFPGMFDHNGKQYAGIQFYFIVFPYRAGDFTLPPIVVHATTPPEGSSESKPITLKTPQLRFVVKPVPADSKDEWFVAKSATIHERWNKSLAHLKVGDVIERTVIINAKGTLPQFIPVLKEQKLNFANVYPQDPELKDLRDDYDANGELTQSFIYLMEKEGSFTIPPMAVSWWNPNARKMNKRSLRQHKITVQPNPDLGMVATIKDSLEATQHPVAVTTAKKTLTIMGMKWYVFAAFAVPALAILYFLLRLLWRFIQRERKHYMQYKQSELYWFRHVLRSSSPKDVWIRLYEWWDRVDYDDKADGFVNVLDRSGDTEGSNAMSKANEDIYHNNQPAQTTHEIKGRLSHLRKWLIAKQHEEKESIPDRQRQW
ncbi:MAG: BatD family protein [Chryseolinea sp.]